MPGLWTLPLLVQVQFPFRALPLAEFALVTVLVDRLRERDVMVALALPWVLLAPAHTIPPPQRPDAAAKLATYPDVGEYLPNGVIPGNEWNGESRRYVSRLPPVQRPGVVTEPHFWFPAWSCGSEDPVTHLLVHPPGCRPVIVRTPAEKWGMWISLLAALAFAGQLLFTRAVRGSNEHLPSQSTV